MRAEFSRFAKIVGSQALDYLASKKVAIFGLGGVGGYVLEGLVRSGIGKLVLVDGDDFELSNLNRQLLADMTTLDLPKVELGKRRALSINPEVEIEQHNLFYLPENQEEVILDDCDYVVDAIDTVAAKIALIEKCQSLNIPIIASMGTGNKLNPMDLRISDIYQTNTDPLARVMRHELRKRGITSLKVLYSIEKPLEVMDQDKRTPGSSAFVPACAGLIIASEVIKDLLKNIEK